MFDQNPGFDQKDGDHISIGTCIVMHFDILNEDRLLFVHLLQNYKKFPELNPENDNARKNLKN